MARAFADQVTVLTVAARRRGTLTRQRREQAWLLDFSLELLTLSEAAEIAETLLARINALYGLQGTLVFGPPTAPEGEGPPGRPHLDSPDTLDHGGLHFGSLRLDWPGAPGAHLLFPGHTFGPQDQALLRQATRAANTALATLSLRQAVAG